MKSVMFVDAFIATIGTFMAMALIGLIVAAIVAAAPWSYYVCSIFMVVYGCWLIIFGVKYK